MNYTFDVIIIIIIIKMEILNYVYKINETLNKKLKLPAGGGQCPNEWVNESFIISIRSNSFRNALYACAIESLLHSIDSLKTRIHLEIKLGCVLLGDKQMFCSSYTGNIFIGKIEQMATILFLKYNTVWTYKSNC